MTTPASQIDPRLLDDAGDAAPVDAGLYVDRSVVVGRYTPDEGTRGIQRIVLGPDGARREAAADLLSPSWMTRAAGLIFAACESSESRLAAVREDAEGFTVLSTVATDGQDACHVAASPDSRWIALAHYTSGSVRLVELPRDGKLDGALRDLMTFEGSGPDPERQDAPHAHQVTWLDETHFLCNDLGTDQIRVLQVAGDGTLTQLEPIHLPAGFGPRHLVVRGHQLAVVGELSGDLASFQHDGEAWDAGWSQVDLVKASGSSAQNQPSGLALVGDDLVVGNRRIDTIARFTWDEAGRLALRYENSCGGAMPRDVAVDDDRVWVALQEGNAVVVFRAGDDGFQELTRFPVEGAARVLF